MLAASYTDFPNNVIKLIATRIPTYVDDKDIKVLLRPLRPSDPQQCVGVFPLTVAPDEETIEMPTLAEPTINRYTVVLQTFVVDTDEEAAIAIHSVLSKKLRRMLFQDSALHVGLTALQVVDNNVLERFQRRGVTVQRFISNEIRGSFLQTSWMEHWFETETVVM